MPSLLRTPCSSCVMLARQESSAQDAVIDRDNIVTPTWPMPGSIRLAKGKGTLALSKSSSGVPMPLRRRGNSARRIRCSSSGKKPANSLRAAAGISAHWATSTASWPIRWAFLRCALRVLGSRESS
jgi:hypothetical protein